MNVMRFLVPFLLVSAAFAQVTPPPATLSPASLVYQLASKRGWTETMTTTPFCAQRATANASVSYPKDLKAKVKVVRTFSFTSTSSPSNERTMLDFSSGVGFTVPYPWRAGDWISRQYGHDTTPKFAYLLELKERPAPNAYSSGGSDVCMTVFALR